MSLEEIQPILAQGQALLCVARKGEETLSLFSPDLASRLGALN